MHMFILLSGYMFVELYRGFLPYAITSVPVDALYLVAYNYTKGLCERKDSPFYIGKH